MGSYTRKEIKDLAIIQRGTLIHCKDCEESAICISSGYFGGWTWITIEGKPCK